MTLTPTATPERAWGGAAAVPRRTREPLPARRSVGLDGGGGGAVTGCIITVRGKDCVGAEERTAEGLEIIDKAGVEAGKPP